MIAPAPTLHPALVPVSAGRWTPSRKEGVVEAIRLRRVTIAQVCAAHDLSAEELASWQRRHAAHGRDGLAVLRTQEIRL